MRITSKGQVTIPIDIRERAGLLPHTEVEWAIENGKVVLRPADGLTRGQRLVERLRNSATANTDMSADELFEMMRGPWEDLPEEPGPGLQAKARRFVPKK
ncbi:AbrB/MazE/SpoVT family DNA-binding domain-containing protein [Brevundimonas sp.]|uniref:AbrB/MazE/SpoVT family DNA-binding domain-containing protein n=1 Tax=Brevundimonas sp. TaxID=1871086 RepID=UPI003A9099BB